MRKVFPLSILVGLVAFAMAQAPAYLYSPSRAATDQGISLVGWGSGTIVETDEAAYEGTSSIRVSTRNFFQGGLMNYSTALNLATAFQDPNNLLMFALRVPDANTTMGGSAGSPSGSPSGSSSAGSLGGEQGDGRGAGAGGAPSSAGSSSQPVPGKFDTLRIILSTTDGKKSETYLPINSTPNAKGWMQVGLPLKAITGFAATNQSVKSIAISGNSAAAVYIGEIRIMNDSTPIYGELLVSDMNIGTGTSVNLTASGSAGATLLKYTWSVQGTDGPAFTFEGQSIARNFRKPGTFKVFCTISDVYGLKKPYVTNTVNIVVN